MRDSTVEQWTMQRWGRCRPCGKTLETGMVVVKHSCYGGQDQKSYLCMGCAREVAKIALATADLDEFGEEMVMDKLKS